MASKLAYESRFQQLTRVGFAARGFLYILIAALVILTGRTEDLTGALKYLGHGIGKLLLVVLACGMAVYALWRLADAGVGMESGRGWWKAIRKRIAAAASGIIYAWLSYKAAMIALAQRPSGNETQRHAADALHLPGGELLLLSAAAILFGAGLVQLWKAAKCTFLKHLDESAGAQAWVKWLGRIGYAARGIIFLVVGYLLLRAGLDRNPAEAGNLDEALDLFSGSSRNLVALGLALFGGFSIVEARYRRIHKPPVEEVRREVAQAVQR